MVHCILLNKFTQGVTVVCLNFGQVLGKDTVAGVCGSINDLLF